MAGRDLFESDDEALEARARADLGNPFADAAELAEKRRPGRPKGALNHKTKDFERYYQAMGFRDPLQAMAQLLTADPVALAAWFEKHEPVKKLRPSLFEIVKAQHGAAVDLAPYLHGKKPVQVEIIDERLPTLIIDLGTNQLAEARKVADRQALSAGAPIDVAPLRDDVETDATPASGINEINDLDEAGE